MNLEELQALQTSLKIEVSLFVNGEHIDRMFRKVAPSLGDTIVIDCGEMVKVIEINHQWDSPDLIQINCVSIIYNDIYENDKKNGGEDEG